MIAATALCIALTACGADIDPDDAALRPSPQPATGPASGTELPVKPDATGVTPVAVPTLPEPKEPAEPEFGKTFTYTGGITVRIEEPERFTPSAWVKPLAGTPMRFQVTLRNTTAEEFNPSQLHVTLRSTFAEAVQIFDYEQGVVARPEDRLKPGRTVRFAVGYWVSDPQDMVMEFAPGFEYEPTHIKN